MQARRCCEDEGPPRPTHPVSTPAAFVAEMDQLGGKKKEKKKRKEIDQLIAKSFGNGKI